MNILVISPYFRPFLAVGARRMTSLVDYISSKSSNSVTVIKNSNETYGTCIDKTNYNITYDVIETKPFISFRDGIKSYRLKVYDVIAKKKPDIVIISVGPFYTLALVKDIKKRYRDIKVILDYRDFWVYEPDVNRSKSFLKKFIQDKCYERPAFRWSDLIVNADEADQLILMEHYKKEVFNKMVAIRNGFEYIQDFNNISFYDEKTINIGVFGKLAEYLNEEQITYIASSSKSIEEKNNIKIKWILIGALEENFQKKLDYYGVAYEYLGYMKYDEGMKVLKERCSCLAVSTDLEGIGLGTKFFDYIYCNKPIIFFGKDSTFLLKKILEFQNGVYGMKYSDFEEIIEKIEENKDLVLDPNIDVYEYSRERSNKKYLENIERLYLRRNFEK